METDSTEEQRDGDAYLGGDVELVDVADLLGDLLAGVGGEVRARLLQEPGRLELALLHRGVEVEAKEMAPLDSETGEDGR